MKCSVILILLLALFGLALAAKPVTKPGNGGPKVCRGAKLKPAPGGWTLLTKKQAANDANLMANVKAGVAVTSDCTVKKISVQKACYQIVNGQNYQWNAKVQEKCGKKTKNSWYNGSFTQVLPETLPGEV